MGAATQTRAMEIHAASGATSATDSLLVLSLGRQTTAAMQPKTRLKDGFSTRKLADRTKKLTDASRLTGVRAGHGCASVHHQRWADCWLLRRNGPLQQHDRAQALCCQRL
jgi:hypothetical protein